MRPAALILFAIVACLAGSGCGSKRGTPKQTPMAAVQLRTIGRAYVTMDEPPRNKEDLMPNLKLLKKDNPEDEGTPMSPAEILRSPNDGEEFVICYGLDVKSLDLRGDPRKLPVIAYEKNGKDGKRWVLQIREPREVADEDLDALPFPQGFPRPK